ncbi:type VII secretion integral membrane protein EccD [Streptomyces clavuligerus]|uniref:Putative membrane protein n=2 Tax=Streptomyces clavuligerus TaxID=1901 RepID=E2Q9Z7_STRCL|nr:type VII secretion integral membrane protein EccD [Streptomyces clavuligerus]ANW17770.1 type VII secretion integral membrane protein EccD [Streptomyces clavuligerus]AXU12322.1 type VII secretion integral membrane protein EccD [Streptomyces clavuligerus]EFG09696.1 Putative membrane protein [Streptomyces clavuligerus]MBY6302200.1 type VII secretion integral membrane protein EccD [Streptomyces clavuligerus]QCS05103.1 type VII secretion integral membrane protein EccD [Streptomyces clavuligerus]
MSASTPVGPMGSTGFCRVTVVAPDGRVDVALPDDLAVADLYPEILRLSGQSPAPGAPVGYHLVRRDGTVLDGARSLGAQRILDGELLSLRPFAESLPPAVFDDVTDAVATAVVRDRGLWNEDLTRGAALFGGSVLLLLLAFVLWSSAPRHDTHGLPGVLAAVAAVLLLAVACVRARVYDDRGSAVALGTGALANAAVAGSGLLPPADGQGAGRLHFLLACAAVLVAAVILTLVSPGGDSPFVAFVLASAVGASAAFAALLYGLAPVETAALCAPLAVGALAFLPGLATRVARLPIGFDPPRTALVSGHDGDTGPQGPVDAVRIAARARRGHELLIGLVGGCALLAVGSAAVLGFSDNGWARLLALATGVAMLMRAHLFRYTAQVACALAAGLASLVLLGLGVGTEPPAALLREALRGDGTALDLRTVWLAAAVAGVAALITAIGLIVPRTGVTPFWGRFLEIAETCVLLTLIPLALAVFDVYHAIRATTS